MTQEGETSKVQKVEDARCQVVVEPKLQGPNISIKHPDVTLAPDRFFDPLYRKLQ